MYNNTFSIQYGSNIAPIITLIWVLSSYHHHYLNIHILYYFDIANRISFRLKFVSYVWKIRKQFNETKVYHLSLRHTEAQRITAVGRQTRDQMRDIAHVTQHIENTWGFFFKDLNVCGKDSAHEKSVGPFATWKLYIFKLTTVRTTTRLWEVLEVGCRYGWIDEHCMNRNI